MENGILRLLGVALFCCGFGWAYGQTTAAAPPQTVFDYLTQEEGAKIRLELDLDSLVRNRKNASYLPATLINTDGVALSLEVRTRGKFRRRKCAIPPVKLKFGKRDLAANHLDTLNEIKLVLPCIPDNASNDLIVREYLAYRMYETLTPACTRARLVRLELKNHAEKRPKKMLALFVEHEEQVVARLQGIKVADWGVDSQRLEMVDAALMVLFQYMIGNTDWEIGACRNILLLQIGADHKLTTIPFDFDFSGLVSAPYAAPNSECNLKTVRDRFLMARGIDPEALRIARTMILDKRGEFYAMLRNEYLNVESRIDMTAYLDLFFDMLSKQEDVPQVMEFTTK